MKIILLIISLFACFNALGQQVTFRQTDQKIKVYKGTSVEIEADTAFVISNSRAHLLNEKLSELEAARALNSEILEKHKELKEKILEIEELLGNLVLKMRNENDAIALDFEQILKQLDTSLVTLRQNNNELAQHNRDLKTQINTMQSTIKVLKKEIRGIWWNGALDKVVVGAASIVIGFILGSTI